MKNQELLLDLLREAHAMEDASVMLMQKHAHRLGNFPHLETLLVNNAVESRQQAIRLRACIEALGGSATTLTVPPDGLNGVSQALARVFVERDAAHGVLALYALKHLEIGAYRLLIRAAERLQESDIAAICRHNLKEELEMVGQMEVHLEAMPESWMPPEEPERGRRLRLN